MLKAEDAQTKCIWIAKLYEFAGQGEKEGREVEEEDEEEDVKEGVDRGRVDFFS